MKAFLIIAVISLLLLRLAYRLIKKAGGALVSDAEFLETGYLLFPDDKPEFEVFFKSWLADKKKFSEDNEELLDNFDGEKLKALEVLYVFGNNKKLLWLTDWKGEENESEVEAFIEKQLNEKPDWTATNKFRADNAGADQRDGKFIIDLFVAIDKDLQAMGKQLIFFSLGWDGYVYIPVDIELCKRITGKLPYHFHGTEKLRK